MGVLALKLCRRHCFLAVVYCNHNKLSILFTFLLNRADGNLWTAIILHTFFNLANCVLVWERFNINLLLIEIFGLACIIVILLDKKRMFEKHK